MKFAIRTSIFAFRRDFKGTIERVDGKDFNPDEVRDLWQGFKAHNEIFEFAEFIDFMNGKGFVITSDPLDEIILR